MARATSFSFVPSVPTVPVSCPPWPGSMTTRRTFRPSCSARVTLPRRGACPSPGVDPAPRAGRLPGVGPASGTPRGTLDRRRLRWAGHARRRHLGIGGIGAVGGLDGLRSRPRRPKKEQGGARPSGSAAWPPEPGGRLGRGWSRVGVRAGHGAFGRGRVGGGAGLALGAPGGRFGPRRGPRARRVWSFARWSPFGSWSPSEQHASCGVGLVQPVEVGVCQRQRRVIGQAMLDSCRGGACSRPPTRWCPRPRR
jgi:hypothetical protein